MNKSIILILFLFSLFLSCSDSDERKIVFPESPRLIEFAFCVADNPLQLIEDVKCDIIGDSIVECYIPNIVKDKNLIARWIAFGGVVLEGNPLESGTSVVDCSKPVEFEVKLGNEVKRYMLYVHTFTGLPIVWIDTENHQEILIRDQYMRAYFRMEDGLIAHGVGDITEDSMSIKGRGNTTWTKPKKPYRLKFDHKQSLFGAPNDKAWILLANYCDKTMLRIATAFYISALSNLMYTPKCHFVEVMLNGRYNGTYLLCEKIKVAEHRVNVGGNGFLLEVDVKRPEDEIDARYFSLSHLPKFLDENYVNIKEPNVEYGDDNYNFISSYVQNAEKVLFSNDFLDPALGWKNYMDMDSFVDWYLINEISKNNDAIFYSSCFMSLKRGGKLRMGPVWDFDIAFGNVNYNENWNYEGFWVRNADWISRMFEDPEFVNKVYDRFDYFYSKKWDIIQFINENANYLRLSAIENEHRWHTLYQETWPNYDIWGSYYNEVQSMKYWLDNRFEWLKEELTN